MNATQTAIRVPVGHDFTGPVPTAGVTAVFTAPDGTEMPVKVTLFQLGRAIGVGVYSTDDRGTVLRWDRGPQANPTVIHWSAPEPGTIREWWRRFRKQEAA